MAAFTRLSGATMRTVSEQWVTDPDTRKTLESHAKTRALLPDIEEAHQDIIAALGADGGAALQGQLAALRARGDVVDRRHDRKYRGSYKLLDALAELADTPETASALITLRDQLHPNGLVQVNATWADEAGNAATVRQGLDKAVREQLKDIATVEGRTLDDEVQSWLKAGAQLGPLAAQKAAVEHQAEHPDEERETPAMNTARSAWIKVARALESNLELVKGLSSEQRGAILGLLHRAAATAERRGAERRKGEIKEVPPKPDAPTG